MVNTVSSNPGANRAFSDLLQNTPALKSTNRQDALPALQRLYVNSRGDVRQSSNAISHAFRQFLGKPVGLDAVRHALSQQVGEQEADRLILNTTSWDGNLETLADIDDVINGKKFATFDPELDDDDSQLQVEDFDAEDEKTLQVWNEFNSYRLDSPDDSDSDSSVIENNQLAVEDSDSEDRMLSD